MEAKPGIRPLMRGIVIRAVDFFGLAVAERQESLHDAWDIITTLLRLDAIWV